MTSIVDILKPIHKEINNESLLLRDAKIKPVELCDNELNMSTYEFHNRIVKISRHLRAGANKVSGASYFNPSGVISDFQVSQKNQSLPINVWVAINLEASVEAMVLVTEENDYYVVNLTYPEFSFSKKKDESPVQFNASDVHFKKECVRKDQEADANKLKNRAKPGFIRNVFNQQQILPTATGGAKKVDYKQKYLKYKTKYLELQSKLNN